jgi:eukaryotic translation initiation factor 2C
MLFISAIMALDVLIRHSPSSHYTTVGRAFYTPDRSKSLYGGVEAWQGYYQSARPTIKRMMINVDISATAFYKGGSLVEIVTEILGRGSPLQLGSITQSERTKLEKFLKGLKIHVMHRGEQVARKKYQIIKLTSQSAEQTEFECNEETTNVVTYFRKTYHRRLLYPKLPCVVVRSGGNLPMEICEVEEVSSIIFHLSLFDQRFSIVYIGSKISQKIERKADIGHDQNHMSESYHPCQQNQRRH